MTSIAFSPDGKTLVSGSEDGKLHLWHINKRCSQNPKFLGQHDKSVQSVAFSPDGQIIASGSVDHTLRLWGLEGKGKSHNLFRGHNITITSVAFSPDGKTIASSGDSTIRLWDLENNLVQKYCFDFNFSAITFSSYDNQLLVFREYQEQFGWYALEEKSFRLVVNKTDHRLISRPYVISGDNQIFAMGNAQGQICLWNQEGNLIKESLPNTKMFRSIALSKDGKKMVTLDRNWEVYFWDLESLSSRIIVKQEDHRNIECVALTQNGEIIATGGLDGKVCLWNEEGNLINHPFQGNSGGVKSIVFSPNDQYIACGYGSSGKVLIWDQDGNLIGNPLEQHKDRVDFVTFSPDGQYLASGSTYDNTIFVWAIGWKIALQIGCDRLRDHPVFKNPVTEEEKQACQTCHEYVWHPEIGAEKLYEQARKRIEAENFQTAEEKDFTAAIAILALVIQLNPGHADAYYHRGKCYAELNKTQKTTEDFKEAATLYQQQGKTETEEYKEIMKFLNHFKS